MQSKIEKLLEFVNAFDYGHDNDREIAIVGCAYLEMLIKAILQESLINDPKEANYLLSESTGSLAGIIPKARLLYLLGIIPSVIFQDLKTVAKIRNEFAHNVSVSFESSQIKQLCKNLKWHEQSMFMPAPNEATAKEIYQVGVNQLVTHLGALPSLQKLKMQKRN